MADLLSHVLIAYALLTVAGWRVEGVTRRWVVVGMGGAAIPDLVKVDILVHSRTVESVLGVPFSYRPLSTLGGVVLAAGLIALLFARRHRWRAYGFLLTGGATSLLLDGLRVSIGGRTGHWLYPVTWWQPPSPTLYITANPRVLGATLAVALAIFLVDRRRSNAGVVDGETPASAESTGDPDRQ